MITIFNRRELLISDDPTEFARVRDVLACNGIDYITRVIDRRGGRGEGISDVCMLGLDPAHIFQYVIYVRGKDLEEAEYLMYKDRQ